MGPRDRAVEPQAPMIIREDEVAILVALLRDRNRTLVDEQRVLEQRKKRIAFYASQPGPLEARLVHLVAEDLATYGLTRAAAPSLAVRLVNRLRLVGLVREAAARAELRNVGWAREDAIHKGLAEVHTLVAARTGNLVRWITEEDDRVCGICEPRHGVLYTPSTVPPCPAHPRCRCWPVAVYTRAARAA